MDTDGPVLTINTSPRKLAGITSFRLDGEVIPTLQRQLEKAVIDAREQHLRYQELFEFAPDGYVITDRLGIIVEANHAAAAILRCHKHFLKGKPIAFFFDSDSRHAFYRQLSRDVLSRRESYCREAQLRQIRSKQKDVVLMVTLLFSETNQSCTLRWLIRDISRVRQIEQALRTQQRFADNLVEAAEALILVVDARGRILRSNPYVYNNYGYSASELLHANWCDLLIAPNDQLSAQNFLLETLRLGSSRSHALVFLSRDGRQRSIIWSARTLDSVDNAETIVLLGHDVTELQETQQQVLQAEQLAALGRTATMLAHESRNALQRIQSCATILSYRLQDQPDAFAVLGRLQQAQDDLCHLFENIRSFASPLLLERRACNMAEIWRQVWANLAHLLDGRPTELRESIDGVDLWCMVDAFRLRQVFRNLLENALSTEKEVVTIEILCSETDLVGQPALRIAVRDNGPGFTAEQRRRVFEPFYTTKVQGTGLGLTICQRIVEAHGGRITLGEKAGPGAEIIITLPRSES